MVFRHSYALIAAGSPGRTIIGRLPRKARQIGPVAAVSYRVASRIANTLRAGWPVREMAEIKNPSAILFHAPPDQMEAVLARCFESAFDWSGVPVIFCDCEPRQAVLAEFSSAGAVCGIAGTFGVAGYAAIRGCPRAVLLARRITREVGLRPLEISNDRAQAFEAAITLGTAALTPLIDRAAYLLRCAGVRDADSIKVAERLFQQTVRGFAHSGRQSWAWHIAAPCGDDLRSQIGAIDPTLAAVVRDLLLLGFDTFEKHPEVAASLRAEN